MSKGTPWKLEILTKMADTAKNDEPSSDFSPDSPLRAFLDISEKKEGACSLFYRLFSVSFIINGNHFQAPVACS